MKLQKKPWEITLLAQSTRLPICLWAGLSGASRHGGYRSITLAPYDSELYQLRVGRTKSSRFFFLLVLLLLTSTRCFVCLPHVTPTLDPIRFPRLGSYIPFHQCWGKCCSGSSPSTIVLFIVADNSGDSTMRGARDYIDCIESPHYDIFSRSTKSAAIK